MSDIAATDPTPECPVTHGRAASRGFYKKILLPSGEITLRGVNHEPDPIVLCLLREIHSLRARVANLETGL